ncbi:MAG: DUF4159 domain-containing protein [Gemmatimonadetes bacterium]|nr:DUF4159 domain-containing protein [Gemmatimonadota bacterium]
MTRVRWWSLRRLLGTVGLIIGSATMLQSQRFGRMYIEPNVPYDGRFTFVRLRYLEYGPAGWQFDYPAMERNLMTIVKDLTTMRLHQRGSNVHLMDDPSLSRYPIAYLSEPGYWYPEDREAAGLRAWLRKGGFLIVDDFYFRQWEPFAQAMRKVLPEATFIRLDASQGLFDSFFRVTDLGKMHHPDNASATAEYYGIFEDNDPSKRLMVIVNYNNDVGDYMEWSGQGWYPVNMSNDAYKIATNWLVYGLTH